MVKKSNIKHPFLSKNNLLIVLSGIFLAIGIMHLPFFIAWISLVPFLTAIQNKTVKQIAYSGLLLGITSGAIIFYWMPEVVGNFTGGKNGIAILAYLLSILLLSLNFSLFSYLYAAFRIKSIKYIWVQAFYFASIWTLQEYTFSIITTGMPWFNLRLGCFILKNNYAIQIASFGGVYLITFFIAFINYIVAHFLFHKKWIKLLIPLGAIGLYLGVGFIIYITAKSKFKSNEKPVSIVVLNDNISAEEKWNKNNGNRIVQNLLSLDKQAVALKPDIVLWSETVVPWTYRKDDDFINEIIKISQPNNITNIIGIATLDTTINKLLSSAYCINSEGKILGRYDKRHLLKLAEQPLTGISLPFLNSDGYDVAKGQNAQCLPTLQGKAGVIICNEATIPSAATSMVQNGATFMVTLTNDGWFGNVPYLALQHFYNTRLRAVEVRRDIAVCSNLGVSGFISALGDLTINEENNESLVMSGQVVKRNQRSVFSKYSNAYIYLNLFFVFMFIIYYFYLKFKKQPL